MVPESQLLTALSCGDESAFTHLYNTRWKKLYKYALSIVDVKRDAEDVCADVFSSIWEKRDLLEKVQGIDNYLIVLVRNRCFDFVRTAKRQKQKKEELDKPPVVIEGHDKRVEILSLYTGIVLNKIDLLPFTCQLIIRMYYMDGLSHDEIAQSLQLSKNTIRNHRYNGLRLLKEMSDLVGGQFISAASLLLAARFLVFFSLF